MRFALIIENDSTRYPMRILLSIVAAAAVYRFLGTPRGQKVLERAHSIGLELKNSALQRGREIVTNIKEHAETA